MVMVSIVKDYLNKITIHSESLSRTEKYINKPWVHIDSNGNYQKYIFNPDGDLFMSFNGKVEIGKWKYLSEANLIFIDRLTDKIFLKQSFFDESVMILKIDSTQEDLFILANENIIPDLDVAKYLSSLNFNIINPINETENSTFINIKLTTGDVLSINRNGLDHSEIGMGALLNNKKVTDGLYFVSTRVNNELLVYQIIDSKINKIFWRYTFKTSKGVLKLDQKSHLGISIGDSVFLNDNPAPNGKYKLEFMSYIHVINGVIYESSFFS